MNILELRWTKIPLELKKLYVQLLLSDGFTRDAIGSFFGTSKNAVVGFQHSQLPKLTGKGVGTKDTVTTEHFEKLLDSQAEKTGKKVKEKTPSIEVEPDVPAVPVQPEEPEPPIVSRTLAATETVQCAYRDEKGHRCGYEHLPDSDSCGRVGHEA